MEVEAGLGCECALCDRGLMSLQSHQLSLAEEEVKQKSGLGLVVCGVRSPAVLAPLLGSEHVKVLPPRWPLPLLFPLPLPGPPVPQIPLGSSFSSRRSQLSCHLLSGPCPDDSSRVTFAPSHSLDTSPVVSSDHWVWPEMTSLTVVHWHPTGL